MEKDLNQYTSGMSAYDKQHKAYRIAKFIKFMELREKEFVNSFSFEGDEEFTLAKQRMFLKLLFRYGYSGIVDTTVNVINKIDKDTINLATTLDIDISSMIKKEFGNKIPVYVAPTQWDYNERVLTGKGITAGLNNVGRKIFDVNRDNTAIAQFDNSHKSGYYMWLEAAYIHSTGETVLKKRLAMLDAKLVNNKINNTQRGVAYDAVYDVEKSFIELAPEQKSIGGGTEEEINIEIMLDAKIKKLDISNGETVNDILEFVQAYEKEMMSRFGERTNINEGKQERSITADFTSMEVHWRRLEQETKSQLQMFVEEYKEVFGKELTWVSIVETVISEQDAKEMAKTAQNDPKGGSNE